MADPNLEFWDKVIKELESMDYQPEAVDFTDYEELAKWASTGT